MQPGSIVICIDDSRFGPDVLQYVSAVPRQWQVYVVRELIPDPEDPNGEPGVALEEIWGRQRWMRTYTGRWQWVEYHFFQWRFAELVPPPTAWVEEETELVGEEVH